MSQIIKPLSNTIDIGTTANDVYNASIVKVVNQGSYATLVFKTSDGTQYADVPVAQNESVIVQKSTTDIIVGAGMYAVSIAWPKG